MNAGPHPAGDGTAPLRIVLMYAAFAALWILVSDSVVEWLFADPAQIVMASMFKGWLFVAVTSLLLYVLMRRMTSNGKVGPPDTARGALRWLPALLAVGTIVLLTGLGITHTVAQQKEKEVARLQAIADLKTELIGGWLKERQREADFIRSSALFSQLYLRWQQGDGEVGDRLKSRLAQFRSSNGFSDVVLLSPGGQPLWDTFEVTSKIDEELRSVAAAVSRDGRIRQHGPYRDSDGRVHLDFLAPITMARDEPSPVVVLHASPYQWLFPALQRWPIPSASGETLLFRRDGEDVLFLNELRHHPDSAAKHRLPLGSKHLLAAQVLRGEVSDGDIVSGRDYRNVPVLGVVRAIADSDWYLIAKLDEEEIYAEAMKDASWITMAGLLALFIALAAGALQQQRSQLQFAETLQESEERFRALVEQALAGIYIIQDGRFRYVNPGFAAIFGYDTPDQLIDSVPLRELVAPADRDRVEENIRRRTEGETVGLHYVFTGLRRDGSFVDLEVHGRAFDYQGRPAVIGLILDITARRQAEERLRLWAESFEHADFALAIADATTNTFLAVNPTFAKERGYTQEELTGKPIMSVYPSDLIAATKDKIAMLDLTGHGVFEGEHATKDGRRFPVLMDITVIKSDDGKPQTRIAYALDITDRTRVEAVLRASEKRFHDIVEATADWVWEVDADFRYTYVSDNVIDLLGYRADEVIGKTPFDFMPPDEAERVRAEFSAIAAQRRPFRDLDNINRRKDGKLRYVSTNGMPMFDADGAFAGYRGLDRDVTEQKLAETDLRAAKDQLRTVINTIPDLIWLKDTEGRYLACNTRFELFFGATEAEIAGKTDYDFVPRELADAFRANDRAALEAGQSTENEEEVTFASDGHHERLLTIKTPFRGRDGKIIGVLGVARDITARKVAEQELRQRNVELERFNLATIDREIDMIGLKQQVNALAAELGRPAPHDLGFVARAGQAEDQAP